MSVITSNDKCFIPNCGNSGNKSWLFPAPQDKKQLLIWTKSIGQTERKLTSLDFVCEKHFAPFEIIRGWGTNSGSLLRPELTNDAKPTLFLSQPVGREPLTNGNATYRKEIESPLLNINRVITISDDDFGDNEDDTVGVNDKDEEKEREKDKEKDLGKDMDMHVDIPDSGNDIDEFSISKIGDDLFACLYKNGIPFKLPQHCFVTSIDENNEKYIVFSKTVIKDGQPWIKVMLLCENLKLKFFLNGLEINISHAAGSHLTNHYELAKALRKFMFANICPGGPQDNAVSIINNTWGRWRHKQCLFIIKDKETCCANCQNLYK